MIDLVIRGGAEDMAVLSRRLKEAGSRDLTRELRAGLQRAAKPAKEDVRRSLASRLPHRGGLAAQMAGSRISLRATGSGRSPGVRIVANSPHDLRSMDKGTLNHPVFGNKDVWRTQAIEPGVFSEPIERRAPQMREEMTQAIRAVAAKIEAGH